MELAVNFIHYFNGRLLSLVVYVHLVPEQPCIRTEKSLLAKTRYCLVPKEFIQGADVPAHNCKCVH